MTPTLEQAIEQMRKIVSAEYALDDRPTNDDEADHVALEYHHAMATTSFPAILAAMEQAKAEIDAFKHGVEQHNKRMAAVPTLGNIKPTMPQGLRFLADWFTAFYADSEDRQLENDLRRWAEEDEEKDRYITDLAARLEEAEKVVDGLRSEIASKNTTITRLTHEKASANIAQRTIADLHVQVAKLEAELADHKEAAKEGDHADPR